MKRDHHLDEHGHEQHVGCDLEHELRLSERRAEHDGRAAHAGIHRKARHELRHGRVQQLPGAERRHDGHHDAPTQIGVKKITASSAGMPMAATISLFFMIGPSRLSFSRVQRSFHAAKAPVAPLELRQGRVHVALGKVRPEHVGEIQLRVRALPGRKLLRRCSPLVRMMRSGSGMPAEYR